MRHPLILLAIAAMTLACAGVPGTRPTYRVVSVELVGPLIDATLEWTSRAAPVSSDRLRSLLFPDIESCRALLQEGAEVEYVPGGLTGSISKDGHTCDAVGISDLVQ